MRKGGRWKAYWLIVICLIHPPAPALSVRPETISLRAGTSTPWISQRYHQHTLGLRFQLPWQGELLNWRLASHLDTEISHLRGPDDTAWLYSLGPSITLSRWGLVLDMGILPSYLSRDQLGRRQFGGSFQFTSHIGLSYQLNRHVRFGYRLQHISNANVYKSNDGLDVQAIELWLGF